MEAQQKVGDDHPDEIEQATNEQEGLVHDIDIHINKSSSTVYLNANVNLKADYPTQSEWC